MMSFASPSRTQNPFGSPAEPPSYRLDSLRNPRSTKQGVVKLVVEGGAWEREMTDNVCPPTREHFTFYEPFYYLLGVVLKSNDNPASSSHNMMLFVWHCA